VAIDGAIADVALNDALEYRVDVLSTRSGRLTRPREFDDDEQVFGVRTALGLIRLDLALGAA
jgi:hypothetical protein